MNDSVCVDLGTAAESVGVSSTIMKRRRYWRHCVEISETEPIGCCSGALLLSADHLRSPAYLHLHNPAAHLHHHSSIGFLSPFSRQFPGLCILDCLSYPLHDSQLQPIVHTVDLAMLRKPDPMKGYKTIDSFFIGDECLYCYCSCMRWKVGIQA
jgi:hypothetical protein